MKILCISDQIDPLVYTNTIKTRFSEVDIILSAGDLPMEYLDFVVSSLNKPAYFIFGNHNLKDYDYYRNGQSTGWDISPIDAPAGASIGEPIGAPFGEIKGAGAVHLHGKVRREGGFIVAGLGGSMRYNRAPNQYTDLQMYFEIFRLIPRLLINRVFRGRWLDLLLTHAAPRGIHDREDKCHRGFNAFLWFMRVFKPRYLVHGHIHLYDLSAVRATKYRDTMVINAYSHYVIDTEANNE